MRVYVYEHVTSSTALGQYGPSLEREGSAMLAAVCRDLSNVPKVRVSAILHPTRSADGIPAAIQHFDQPDQFESLVRKSPPESQWLVIAPELDGVLGKLTRALRVANRVSLGCEEAFVGIASDKLRAYRAFGSPMLTAYTHASDVPGSGPIVSKLRYGAGCTGAIVATRGSGALSPLGSSEERIFQEYREGTPASIAAVGTLDGAMVVLPAALQFVHRVPDGPIQRFEYTGGQLPIPSELDLRARRLAQTILRHHSIRGYIGIDVILGPSGTAGRDVVLEINARLTTSYIGYSRWLIERTGDPSLPGRILLGQSVAIPSSDPSRGVVQYSAGGDFHWDGDSGGLCPSPHSL